MLLAIYYASNYTNIIGLGLRICVIIFSISVTNTENKYQTTGLNELNVTKEVSSYF